jgi:hypothetical protein
MELRLTQFRPRTGPHEHRVVQPGQPLCHTIVHIPLRDGVPPGEGYGELVDLVVAHLAAGLRPSKWPGLRRSLGRGTPLTVRTDEARTERHARAWEERPYDRGQLRHTTHARTYFLIGDRDVLANVATSFAYAAGWGPRQKGVVKGRSAFMTSLGGELLPYRDGSRHPEVAICFKPYPPYAHFKRPGH